MVMKNGVVIGKPVEYYHVPPVIFKHFAIIDGKRAEYFHAVLNI